MTYKEFIAFRDENNKKIKALEEETKRVERAYCEEAMEKAGYHIGDTVTNKGGEKGIIVGVEMFAYFHPRAIVAKMKADGTASKVVSYSLGFDIPNIEK